MKFYITKIKGFWRFSVWIIVEALLLIEIPYFSGKFIDSFVKSNMVLLNFALLILSMFTLMIVCFINKKNSVIIARNEELRIQHELLKTLQHLKPDYAAQFINGELGMKFLRDAQSYCMFFRDLYPAFISAICISVIACIVVFCYNYLLALLFLFFMFCMFIVLLPFKQKFAHNNHIIRCMYDLSFNKIFEFIHVYPYLKAMSAHMPFAKFPYSCFKKLKIANLLNDFTNIHFELYNRIIIFCGESCILGLAGFLAWKKIITVGDIVFFQILFLSVLNAFSSIFKLLPMQESINEAKRSIKELYEGNNFENSQCGEDFLGVSNSIIAKNLCFHYSGSNRMLLENFSCKILPGSIVAVTGENGNGKTTLIKLLTGYLEPVAGEIFIGDRLISSYNKFSFRKHIAYVFQESLLISGTLKDNITLKNSEYTDKDIDNALKLSGADSIVCRMKDGLNHKIGFNGGDLSGGERQKIAIARALIRKPAILVFDEVTNHLDYESKQNIKNLLKSLKGKCIIFLVSHDPEMIAFCDYEIKMK